MFTASDRQLYWIDSRQTTVESANLNNLTATRHIVVDAARQASNNSIHFYALSLDDDYIYLTDWSNGYVCT